jgi:hypothetical protein
VSSVIGLLFLVPTSKNTRLEPSIEACWKRQSKWWDVNFKCFEKTWRLVAENKSCQPNEPSLRLYESRWNPKISLFLFFFSIVFNIVFPFIYIFPALWNHSIRDQNYIHLPFSPHV